MYRGEPAFAFVFAPGVGGEFAPDLVDVIAAPLGVEGADQGLPRVGEGAVALFAFGQFALEALAVADQVVEAQDDENEEQQPADHAQGGDAERGLIDARCALAQRLGVLLVFAREVGEVDVGARHQLVATAYRLPQRGFRLFGAMLGDGVLRPGEGVVHQAREGRVEPVFSVVVGEVVVQFVDAQAGLIADDQRIVEKAQVVGEQVAQDQRLLLGDERRTLGAQGEDGLAVRQVAVDLGHHALRAQLGDANDEEGDDADRETDRRRTAQLPTGRAFAAAVEEVGGGEEEQQDGGVGGDLVGEFVADLPAEGRGFGDQHDGQRRQGEADAQQARACGKHHLRRGRGVAPVDEQGEADQEQADRAFR